MSHSAEHGKDFSPAAYAALLSAFAAQGYAPKGFADASPEARHLILRHDIDFSLAAARAMAEQEAELGVRTTYFVLLRTEFYNPLSGAGRAALARIAELGHPIGLHFDAALYENDTVSLDAAAAREGDVLADALRMPIDLVSLHRPGKIKAGEPDRLGGRLNVYAPRYVRDIGYCSDSRGGWHHGHPLAHPAVKAGRALHLLIHPFWWQAPALPPAERLERFLRERADFLDRELARHCAVHRADE
jgi:hypothetical protein